MNIERMKALRDRLLSIDPNQFGMSDYLREGRPDMGEPCGTIGCIAGHAIMMAYPEVKTTTDFYGRLPNGTNMKGSAGGWLGLHDWQATLLFTPNFGHDGMPYDLVTPQMAAAMLDLVMEEGTVDMSQWNRVIGRLG